MRLTPEVKQFIQEHFSEDTDKLLLTAKRFTGIDVPFAVDQILARRRIKDKLPSWYNNEDLIFPSRLSAEQCSSEVTAHYKQRLILGPHVCDLTGGLGIDTWYLSQKVAETYYVERYSEYCEAARTNFHTLGADSIRVISGDASEAVQQLSVDTFYVDPARRGGSNKRVFALSDCEPDILQLKPLLLERSRRVIVKISPMADIEETLRLLPETREVHILAVRNECKELLFVLENPLSATIIPPHIYAVHIISQEEERVFHFDFQEEKDTALILASQPATYLYEPNAALLKSGAFKLIAQRFDLAKLHRHSHLYTSDTYRPDFPGRIFLTGEVFDFSGKVLKQLSKQIPKAHLTIRNFPLTVAELRQRSGIEEGGNIYLFATTLSDNCKVLIQTRKAEKN